MAPSTARQTILCILLLALVPPTDGGAEIASEDLNLVRTVTERDWLGLRLQVLGLRLSYPAYRVHLELGAGTSGPATVAVTYTFWVSAAMAEHLKDAGRSETERVLRYHGRGIGAQVADLVREEFPELWARFDVGEDVVGRFLTPGEEVEDAPQELAVWREGELEWTHRR